jgi:hypothetical protein
VSRVKKPVASSPQACACKTVRHLVSTRRGAGPSGGQDPPDGAYAYAVAESGEFALILWWPQEGFSRARRSTRTRIRR